MILQFLGSILGKWWEQENKITLSQRQVGLQALWSSCEPNTTETKRMHGEH